MNNNTTTKVIVLIFLFVFCSIGCQKRDINTEKNRVLARVGNKTIKINKFQKSFVDNANWKKMIKIWVENQLLNQYRKKTGLNIKKRLGILSVKDVVGAQQLVEKAVDEKISVTPSEVRDYYQNNLSTFKRKKPCARIFSVVAGTNKEASQLIQRLKKDGVSAHGDILNNYHSQVAVVCDGELIAGLNDAIFKGNSIVVGPIKTEFGFHVCHIIDRYKTGTFISLDEVYDDISTMIYLSKRKEIYISLIDSLAATSEIYINDTLLEGSIQ